MRASALAAALSVALAATLSACTTYQDGLAAYDARDYERAYRIWLPLAEAGHLEAQKGMGRLFVFNGIKRPDLDRTTEAVRWLMPCAERKNRICEGLLGFLYYNHPQYEEHVEEILYWFRRSAEQGGGHAMHTLMAILADSSFDRYDPIEALKWAIIFDYLYLDAEEIAAGKTWASLLKEGEIGEHQIRVAERQAAEWIAAHPP